MLKNKQLKNKETLTQVLKDKEVMFKQVAQ